MANGCTLIDVFFLVFFFSSLFQVACSLFSNLGTTSPVAPL